MQRPYRLECQWFYSGAPGSDGEWISMLDGDNVERGIHICVGRERANPIVEKITNFAEQKAVNRWEAHVGRHGSLVFIDAFDVCGEYGRFWIRCSDIDCAQNLLEMILVFTAQQCAVGAADAKGDVT